MSGAAGPPPENVRAETGGKQTSGHVVAESRAHRAAQRRGSGGQTLVHAGREPILRQRRRRVGLSDAGDASGGAAQRYLQISRISGGRLDRVAPQSSAQQRRPTQPQVHVQDPQSGLLRFLLGVRSSHTHRVPKVSSKWRPAFTQVRQETTGYFHR